MRAIALQKPLFRESLRSHNLFLSAAALEGSRGGLVSAPEGRRERKREKEGDYTGQ